MGTKIRLEIGSFAERAATIRADFELRDRCSQNTLPILIFLIVAGALSVVLLLLGFIFGRGRKDPEKLAPYECGFEAFEDSRMSSTCATTWSRSCSSSSISRSRSCSPGRCRSIGSARIGLVAMGIFLAVLVVGFVYEWKKGALEWD